MPISYSESFYTNPRIMQAEQKLLDRFEHNKYPMTMEQLMEYLGETRRGVERVLTQIRRYEGYSVKKFTSRSKPTEYTIIYSPELDIWRNRRTNKNGYVYLGS